MTSELRAHPIQRLDTSFRVPGDKSISHRAAILGGLSDGPCRIRNFLPSEDCVNTLRAMAALGARHEVLAELPGHGPVDVVLHGTSMRLHAPERPIDCGNSGTGMRLLAGMLAGQPFESELFGDASLSSRPMGRVTVPLAEMGARIETLGSRPGCAPLRIHPASLQAIDHPMSVASAQVKSAILLAGLFATGKTRVRQPAVTRDHTERMFQAFGMPVEIDGLAVSIPGGSMPRACDFDVPGDISSAAFWCVAAAALPGSRLRIEGCGLNPSRTAVLDVLRRMGARITLSNTTTTGEPSGTVTIEGAPLQGTTLLPEEIPNLIDEIPVLAVAAALAEGRTTIRNAAELRVKETDRIATVVSNLRAMGGDVTEFDDGMEITGGRSLRAAVLESHGDHRIAMAFLIAGLFAAGETVMHDTSCIRTSYPGFDHQLAAILRGATDPAEYLLPTRPAA